MDLNDPLFQIFFFAMTLFGQAAPRNVLFWGGLCKSAASLCIPLSDWADTPSQKCALCLRTHTVGRKRQRTFIYHPLSCNTKWLWQRLRLLLLSFAPLSCCLFSFVHWCDLEYAWWAWRRVARAHKESGGYWLHINTNSSGLGNFRLRDHWGAVISPLTSACWSGGMDKWKAGIRKYIKCRLCLYIL